MTVLYGVDVSHDEVSEQEAKGLFAAGVRVFAQCLWTAAEQPPPRVINLRNASKAGLLIIGYISVNGSRPGAWHVTQARAGVPDDLWGQLVLRPIDVELAGIPNTTIDIALDRNAKEGGSWLGQRRAIYTSYGHWTGQQQNTQAFKDCLLWNASWDNDPDIDFQRLPYGGWTLQQIVGEQWSGGVNVGGVFADRNSFVSGILLPVPVEKPATTPISEILGQLGRLGTRIDDIDERLKALEPGTR